MKARDFGNIALDRSSRAAVWLRLALQDKLALTHRYQPDPFARATRSDPRACVARFAAMQGALSDCNAPSVLDLGCNQGFFTLSFARQNGVCLGIDNDRGELMTARARAELQRMRNVAFLEMYIDEASVQGLPHCDVVLCLSIFHHWVRMFGQQRAETMLAAIATRSQKALVFDTGQPEETETRWAGELRFMQPDGRTWIEQHLRKLGFSQVHHVGSFPTSLSPVPRDLFVARR